eukprot:gene9116-12297_t
MKLHYPNQLDVPFKHYQYPMIEPLVHPTRKTIVIIPGLDGALAFFEDISPQLTMFYDIILFQIPLKTYETDSSKYTFEFIATELHKIVTANVPIQDGKPSVIIIGESFGGVIGQTYSYLYPSYVHSLVLLSSFAKTELPPEIQFKLDYILPMVENFGYYFPSIAQFLFAQIHVYDVVEPNEPLLVRNLFIKEATYAHFYSVMARIRIVATLDIIEKTKQLTCPTLIIYGESDHFTQKQSFQLYELIKNSSIRSLPGGHLPHITSPREFVQLIYEFLDNKKTK